jgi:hypothetical protein
MIFWSQFRAPAKAYSIIHGLASTASASAARRTGRRSAGRSARAGGGCCCLGVERLGVWEGGNRDRADTEYGGQERQLIGAGRRLNAEGSVSEVTEQRPEAGQQRLAFHGKARAGDCISREAECPVRMIRNWILVWPPDSATKRLRAERGPSPVCANGPLSCFLVRQQAQASQLLFIAPNGGVEPALGEYRRCISGSAEIRQYIPLELEADTLGRCGSGDGGQIGRSP